LALADHFDNYSRVSLINQRQSCPDCCFLFGGHDFCRGLGKNPSSGQQDSHIVAAGFQNACPLFAGNLCAGQDNLPFRGEASPEISRHVQHKQFVLGEALFCPN
jgi:hypothetical protein